MKQRCSTSPWICALSLLALVVAGCDSTPSQNDPQVDSGPMGDGGPAYDFTQRDRGSIPCTAAQVQQDCTDGVCTIPPGCFSMGAPDSDPCLLDSDFVREVVLTRSFTIQQYEVTQRAFRAVMGYNPSGHADCEECPVENVSWHEAAVFSNVKSAAEGLTECYSCLGAGIEAICKPAEAYKFSIYECPGHRLPTEAEWEFAARAGTLTSTYAGDILECELVDSTLDTVAWYAENSDDTTHEVGTKMPNAFGLYDTAGNVGEWMHDWWGEYEDLGQEVDPVGAVDGISKSVRGGSYAQRPRAHRVTKRLQEASTYKSIEFGFRTVRSLP